MNKILTISEINVGIYSSDSSQFKIGDLLKCEGIDKYTFEIVEINNNIIVTTPLNSVIGLKRGVEVVKASDSLSIEYSDQILGKVFSSYGRLIDGNVIDTPNVKGIYNKALTLEDVMVNAEILYTGIKVIDFFCPIAKGFKMGLLGGAGVGKTVVIK